MKKLVVISMIFALMLGVAIWEICYSTKTFKKMHDNLIIIENFINEDGEDIDSPRTLSLMDSFEKQWHKDREILFCFTNHNTLRMLDEKIAGLSVMIKINHAEDAKVTVRTARNLVEAIANDTHPVLSNLL